MTAPHTSRDNISPSINHLRRGTTYRAKTSHGIILGEYLGIESSHGVRAILLRHGTGTASIPLNDVTSIRRSAQRTFLRAT